MVRPTSVPILAVSARAAAPNEYTVGIVAGLRVSNQLWWLSRDVACWVRDLHVGSPLVVHLRMQR